MSDASDLRPADPPGLFTTPPSTVFEHAHDHLVQEVVRRYWNGVWGRLARRDVWLVRQTRWAVVARAGDRETGKVLRWEFETEADAVRMVERLLRPDTAGQWREQDRGGPPTAPREGLRSGPAALD